MESSISRLIATAAALTAASLVSIGACAVPAPKPEPSGTLARDFGDGPATDFYLSVNAEWMAANPIPDEYSYWGVFHEVNKNNQAILRSVLEDAAANADPDSTSINDRIGVFWNAGMDVERLTALRAAPIQGELDRIAAVQDRGELPAMFARLALLGVPIGFGLAAEADLENSSQNIAWLMQDGWGLPDKDYYLRTDDETIHLRLKYGMHIAKLMTQLGDSPDDALATADAVLALETALIQGALDKLQLRNPANYQAKRSYSELQELAPAFDWAIYFETLGIAAPEVVNTPGPEYFKTFDRLYTDRPLGEWKALMRYHLARHAAPYLSDEFARTRWEFFGKEMRGAKAMAPRWKRVLAATEDAMGEGLGRMFTDRAFSPRAKEMANKMIDGLIAAYRSSLEQLDWMGEETRAKAVAKLDAMGRKIGYPATWDDFEGLHFSPDNYLHNAWSANTYHYLQSLEEIGQPVDAEKWGMHPHQVNAYYSKLANEIVFPAGILQPPFFSESQSLAENYGAMGAVIGHEITHGFDDTGKDFDAVGNYSNWWTDEDLVGFNFRKKKLIAQYDACVAIGDLHVNGELTIGENIADLGGVKMAYRAMIATEPAPGLDSGGMTVQQRFFVSWARAWRWNIRPEALKLRAQTDTHSPNPFRANIPLGNLQIYADAFALDPSAPMMVPADERAEIW